MMKQKWPIIEYICKDEVALFGYNAWPDRKNHRGGGGGLNQQGNLEEKGQFFGGIMAILSD